MGVGAVLGHQGHRDPEAPYQLKPRPAALPGGGGIAENVGGDCEQAPPAPADVGQAGQPREPGTDIEGRALGEATVVAAHHR